MLFYSISDGGVALRQPSTHEAFIQCWLDDELALQTVVSNLGSTGEGVLKCKSPGERGGRGICGRSQPTRYIEPVLI